MAHITFTDECYKHLKLTAYAEMEFEMLHHTCKW